LKLLSFSLSGRFAAFRDPSVTSNQTAYYVPSKSAVIGLLGAMIGIQRNNSSLGSAYGRNYVGLFSKTSVGIRYESEPRKITYFTNHRSLENANMKPFKKELLENPRYRIFVLIDNSSTMFRDLEFSIKENRFIYSPYLGHAYCPAVISDAQTHSVNEVMDSKDEITDCVILDESETYSPDFKLTILPAADNKKKPSVMIERHLHHFHVDNSLDSRVLKYWIPVNFSLYRIDRDGKRRLSRFYKIDGAKIVCMF